MNMTKGILVTLAILTLSTSVALAAHRTHRQSMNAMSGVGESPAVWTGGVSNGDRELYIRNQHDSGYNSKNNFNASGNLVAN